MKITTKPGEITLYREPGDKSIGHESTVTHHMRRLLNARDGGGWTRFYPDREGLTACRQGVQNKRTGVYYWHERYQIEDAAKEFNNTDSVHFMGGITGLRRWDTPNKPKPVTDQRSEVAARRVSTRAQRA